MATNRKLKAGRLETKTLIDAHRYGDFGDDIVYRPEALSLKQYYVDSDGVLDEAGALH